MRNYVSDAYIVQIMDRIKSGDIKPNEKTFVFRMKDGRNIGFVSDNEADAREIAGGNGYIVEDLVSVEYEQYQGLTLSEIKAEAVKRNLGEYK